MIIAEHPQAPPKADRPVPVAREDPSDSQQAPPPAYYGSTTDNASHYPTHIYYQHDIRPPAPPQPHRRRSAKREFCKAFCIAVIIWVLMSALIRSFMEVVNNQRSPSWLNDITIPSGIQVESCATLSSSGSRRDPSSSWPYHEHTTLTLPLSADTLFLLSRGSFGEGSLEVVTFSEPSNDVKVDITVKYYTSDTLQTTRICRITREDGGEGVGLFTPSSWSSILQRNRVFFEIKVTIPTGSQSPLRIKNFQTDLPNHSHKLSDLANLVEFERLFLDGSNKPITGEFVQVSNASFKTSNSAISFKGVEAENTKLESSNGPIKGNFKASNSIYLKTSNSRVDVSVELGKKDDISDAKLAIITSNGQVDAKISLISQSAGNFNLKAKTSNQPLHVTITESPLDSAVHLDGASSNAESKVTLPSTYEGTFELKTSNNSPLVKYTESPDPAGRHRLATFSQNGQVNKHITGYKYWNVENKKKGSVSLASSNAPVVIYL